jgi:hypothetical protein
MLFVVIQYISGLKHEYLKVPYKPMKAYFQIYFEECFCVLIFLPQISNRYYDFILCFQIDTDTLVNIPSDRSMSWASHNFHIVHLCDFDEEIVLGLTLASNRPFENLCG